LHALELFVCRYPCASNVAEHTSDPSIVCKGDHVYVYINSRPIQTSKSDLKELVSLVKQRYRLGLEVEEGEFGHMQRNDSSVHDIEQMLN
jgi:lipocalin